MPRLPARVGGLLLTALGGLAAWLITGFGFANYDTMYALVWGRDLARGQLPDYDVPVAPTPHPLQELVGAALSPLGDGAETAMVVLAFVVLGALFALTYLLGAHWFGAAAGALAAAIIITREPVLSFGVRAYVDLPYLALVLGALLVEVRRPQAGLPVLGLLGLAGLLRPEAWLFSFAYVGWLALRGEREPRRLVVLTAAAAAAPVLWALSDLVVTGDPLHSLTGTRGNAEVLERRTGLDEIPLTAPRRIGEILREPVLLGAAAGGLLSLAFLRSRAALPAAAGVAAMVAFCALAIAGLPILGRYLLGPATLLAIFAGAGVFGWTRLEADHPWRRRWQVIGAVVALALLAFIPAQVDRLRALHRTIGIQRAIKDDLRAIAGVPVFATGCRPVGVPNHRPVPDLALWLDRAPADIRSAQLVRLREGLYVAPATANVERAFTLDKNDPRRLTAAVPPGFAEVARNRSWILYARCSRSLRNAR
jgi:hypothetical protein